MKLFSKEINEKLFAQYKFGDNLEKQQVVAKIFNPYGMGRWYLINSDPSEPDYIWAIVQVGEIIEVGVIYRSDLEKARVKPYNLPLERDLTFKPINADILLEGLMAGVSFKEGGKLDSEEVKNSNLQMIKNSTDSIKHHVVELSVELKKNPSIEGWVVAKANRAAQDLADVTHYLDSYETKMKDGGITNSKDVSAYDVLKFRESIGEVAFKKLTPEERVAGAKKLKESSGELEEIDAHTATAAKASGKTNISDKMKKLRASNTKK